MNFLMRIKKLKNLHNNFNLPIVETTNISDIPFTSPPGIRPHQHKINGSIPTPLVLPKPNHKLSMLRIIVSSQHNTLPETIPMRSPGWISMPSTQIHSKLLH